MRKAQTCWVFAALCLALAVGGCGSDSQGGAPEGGPPRSAISGPLPDKGDLLFVLRGSATVTETKGPGPRSTPRRDDRRAKASTDKRDPEADAGLRGVHDRIEVEADTIEWFTDRPQRRAGIAAAHELVDRWKGYGFDEQPPNASLTGTGTDAVVELRKPEKTREGIAFESVAIRGELPPKNEESLSLFIDSSEWETDMHVYVSHDYYCGGNPNTNLTLTNPNIITAPDNWSVPPPESFGPVQGDTQIFNAASKSGTTSFAVEYDLECDGRASGQVTLKGKVPDSLSSNSFSCPVTGNYTGTGCKAQKGSGYHVTSYATFYGD